jgi:hypothetical protein
VCHDGRVTRALLCLGLCGCNAVFGLEATIPLDAQYFDAPPDAPWGCPQPGTLPKFSPAFHQPDVGARYCTDYSVSSVRGLAIALCRGTAFPEVRQGPIDGVLGAATGIAPTKTARYIDEPRLAPEGDEIWIRQVSMSGATDPSVFSVFRAVGDAWEWSADLAVPVTPSRDDEISVPTRRGAEPRRFIFNTPSEDMMLEMVEGTPPTVVRAYRNVELGMNYIVRPMLSPDGLRLVFGGQAMTDLLITTMYADRPSIDSPFGVAKPLEDAPASTDPFLTSDCGKLYASGLGRIFYAQQQ